MLKKKLRRHSLLFFLISALIISGITFSQGFKPPETILPEKMIKIILNEISGQLPFNNEVMMSGYNHIRTEEEFKGFFYEGEYLAKKLREYGVDKVKLEDLGEKDTKRGGWWVRVDAELWMVKPEEKRLSRLIEHPALMARLCDEGDWEGELIYIDRRDIRKLKDMDFTGKIILTPLASGYFSEAFKKGALGVLSYNSPAKSYHDPFQVGFDMGMRKGRIKNKVFGFQIWRQLGDQLKNMIFNGQKVVLRATSRTKTYPGKLDTIFATINGKNPEKKGFMFTAHLYERPAKQGANDNVSGCVALAEIARTITTLIKEGKIERPERSIYFLMGEEGGSTMAFFKKYPEMADKILGVINMDMVGEDLDKNFAFFNIEKPLYSKTSFIDSVAVNFTNYVFETNIEKHSHRSRAPWVDFPVPIVEKNGSKSPFRFLIERYKGGSDHGVFISSDAGVPALSFMVWPDLWYHTDKDRPDKSDPTQLKRVAFIGTAAALAICSGNVDVLKNLVRITYEDRLNFIQEAVSRSIEELSSLKKSDGGETYSNAVNNVKMAVNLSQEALSRIKVLTQGKAKISGYLSNIIKIIGDLSSYYVKHLENYYKTVAKLNGFKPVIAKTSPEEAKLTKVIPVKVTPIKLGDRYPHSQISGALQKDPEMKKEMYRKYGFQYIQELYLSINGKRNLAQIRNLLSFEFHPVSAADFMKVVNILEKEKFIKYLKK